MELSRQIVEAEFGGSAVGYVCQVGAFFVLRRLPRVDEIARKTEGGVDRAHPLAVAPRKVFVDRRDVAAPAEKRVDERGESCD